MVPLALRALVLAVLALAAGPFAAGAQVRFSTDIEVSRAADANTLEIRQVNRVRVPSRTPAVAEIARAPHGSAARRTALAQLFLTIGVEGGSVRFDHAGSPGLVIGPRSATVTWVDTRSVYSFDDLEEWKPGSDASAGSWGLRLFEDEDNLRVHATGPSVQRVAEWTVAIELAEGTLVAVTPLPRDADQRGASWNFELEHGAPTAQTTFSVGQTVGRTLRTGGRWWRAGRALSYFLGGTLVLILMLRWGTPRRSRLGRVRKAGRLRTWMRHATAFVFGEHVTRILTRQPAPRADRVRGAAAPRRLAVAAVLLSAASLTSYLVNIEGISAVRSAGEDKWADFVVASISLGVPIIAAGGLVALGRRQLADWWERRVVVATVMALALALVVCFGAVAGTDGERHPGLLANAELRWALALASILVAVMFCMLVLVGLTLVLFTGGGRQDIRELLARHRVLMWVSLFVISAAIVGQWVMVEHHRHAGQTFPGDPGEQAWWEYLQSDVRLVPLGVLSRLGDLPTVAVGISLLPFLRSLSIQRGGAGFGLRSWPIRLLVLFYSGVIIGTGGILLGAQVPAAFLIGLVATTLILRLPNGRVWRAPLGGARRRALIEDAVLRADLRRHLSDLRSKRIARELTLAEFRVQSAASSAELEDLDRSAARRPRALELGPADNLYGNGIEAMRLGAVVALAPFAYYVIVLVTQRAPLELSADSHFGLLGLASGLISEAAFWLILAFVFGALLPYIRGRQAVWKGLLLGGVFTLSVGLSTVLVEEPSSAWTFRALQVVLVLVVLGYLLDRRTLEQYGFQRSEVADLYRLRDVRFAIGYASPLILLLFGVGQQLLSGDAANAIQSIIEAAPNALPR